MNHLTALECLQSLGLVLMVIGPIVAAAGEMLFSDVKRAKTRYEVIRKYV